jgi:hypothetical protein
MAEQMLGIPQTTNRTFGQAQECRPDSRFVRWRALMHSRVNASFTERMAGKLHHPPCKRTRTVQSAKNAGADGVFVRKDGVSLSEKIPQRLEDWR